MMKRFTHPGAAPIWKSIQYMDHEGMDLLRHPATKGAVDAWESYLSRTKVSSPERRSDVGDTGGRS